MGRGWNHVRQLGRSLLPFPILVLSIETNWKVAALRAGRLLHLCKRVLAAKRLRIEDVAARHNCPTPTRMTTLFQPFRQPPSRLCEELVPFRRTIAALSLRNSKEEKKRKKLSPFSGPVLPRRSLVRFRITRIDKWTPGDCSFIFECQLCCCCCCCRALDWFPNHLDGIRRMKETSRWQ